MSDDLLTTLRFEVDGSGVATGLTSVKRSITDLGNAVKDITDKTNAALGKVGTEELPVAKGLEKASKSIIKQTGDIEKAIATFGSTASTSLKQAYKDINAEEVRLRGMGIDAAIMNPYIEKLREVQKLTAAVAAQERTLAQGAAQAVEAENQRLAHTLELKRQIASVKTTVDNNNAAAQAAKQAEAKAQHQMRLLALNNQIQASNKATADAQAAQSAKAIKDLKDLAAAQAAYRQEVINSELNFTHTGRGKSTAFLADKGQRLGFDSSFIEKELAGYKKVEDAAKAAFQAANPHIAEMAKRAEAAGTSVKGLSASMRNVPAQFTDIIVSLQGGQAPLTVLLQQGGQLKDMFGGVGNAARALGGYVVGLINPFTIAAGVVGTLGIAYVKGAAEGEAYNKALITTGNAAGVTAGQLGEMAKAVAQATGGTVGSAAEALAGLAGTSGIASEQFEKIAAVAVQMEKVTGVAVADTVKQFAELGKDPVGASLKLTESTHYLTAEVYEQIKALTDQGKTLEAGAVAQRAYADAMNGRLPELKDNLGYVEKAWKGIIGSAKGAWDSMLNVGRPSDPGAQIASALDAARAKLADLEKLGNGKNTLIEKASTANLVRDLEQKQTLLQNELRTKELIAGLQKDGILRDEASIRLAQEADKFASKQVLMQREIAKAKALYEGSNKTESDESNYKKRIEGIEKQFAKTAKTVKAVESEYDKLIKKLGSELPKAAAEAEAAQNGYNKAQTEFIALVGGDSWGKFTNDQRATVAALYERKIASEQSEAATKALSKAEQEATKAHEDYLKKLGGDGAKEVASLEARVQKQVQHNAEIGKTAEQIEAVRRAAEESATAELEGQADAIDALLDKNQALLDYGDTQNLLSGKSKEIYELEVKSLREQIKLRKQLAKGFAEGEAKEAGAKAAKDVAAEWKKGWEETDKLARDAFTSWAENGTSMADAIGKSLKKALLSAIYEATLKPIALQIYSSVAGAPPGGVAGSIAGAANTASGLNTLWGAGSQLFTGATAGASSASLLYANGVGAVGGDALGALIAGNGGWAGVSAAAETGAAAAATSGATAGASSVLASIPGWGWAAMGAVALAGLFGGSKGPQLTGLGTAKLGFDAAGNTTSKNNFDHWADVQDAKADLLVASLQTKYFEAARALGIGTVAGGFAYGSNNYNDGQFAIHARVGNASYSTAGTDGIKITDEALALEASRAVFAALKGSELPRHLAGIFDNITASAATQEQISQALAYAQSMAALHQELVALPFTQLHDLTLQATQTLLQFSGGLDTLKQNLSGYYQNFYSQEEQRAQTLKNINTALKETGIQFSDLDAAAADARKNFRALVEALDLTNAADQRTYAALMSVQGAFAGLTTAAQASATAVDAATRAQEDAARANAQAWAENARVYDEARAAEAQRLESLRDQAQGLRDQATQRYLTAQQSVTTAQQTLAGVLRGLVDSFQGVLDGLDGAVSGTASLASARQTFENLTQRAGAGDGTAMQQLAASARTFLDKSKAYSASAVDYRRDEARVRAAMQLGITAGKSNLAALGIDQIDLDPLRSAQRALQDAYTEETNARNLAISMQARLSSAQESLATQYQRLVEQLPGTEGQSLSEYFQRALDTLSGKDLKEAAITALSALVPKLQGNGKTLIDGVIASFKAILPGEVGGDLDLMRAASQALHDILPDVTGGDVDLVQAAIDALDGWILKLPTSGQDFSLQDAAIDAISAILPTLPPGGPEFNFAATVRDTVAGILPAPAGQTTLDMVQTASDVLRDILPQVTGGTFNLAYTAYAALQALLQPVIPTQQAPLDMTGAAAGAIRSALPPIDQTPVSVHNMVQAAVGSLFAGVSVQGGSIAGGGGDGGVATPSVGAGAAPTPSVPTPDPDWVTRAWGQYANPNAPRGSGANLADFVRATYTMPNGGANGGWLWSAAAHAYDKGMHVADLHAAVQQVFPNALPTLEDVLQQLRVVGIPAFAVGTNYVPRDMLAQLHEGEAVVPAAFNPERYAKASGNDALVQEIKALRAEVARLRAENSAENNVLIANTSKTQKVLTKFDNEGMPPERT